MKDEALYSTAAQVIPTISVLVVLQLRTMRLRSRLSPRVRQLRQQRYWLLRKEAWRTMEPFFVFPRWLGIVLMMLFAIAAPLAGEVAAITALSDGTSTTGRRDLVVFGLLAQLALLTVIGLSNFDYAIRTTRSAEARSDESRTRRATVTWVFRKDDGE